MRRFSQRTLSGAMAICLLTAGVFAPSFAASANEEDGEEQPLTESSVELVQTVVPDDYTAVGTVSEDQGDLQQAELIASDTAQGEAAFVARADLNSEIAVLGVTWDRSSAEPSTVEYRALENGVWGEWSQLEIDVVPDGMDATSAGTEPFFLVNAAAVEVLAIDGAGNGIPGIQLTVIDPTGAEEVSNVIEDLPKPAAPSPIEPTDTPAVEEPEPTPTPKVDESPQPQPTFDEMLAPETLPTDESLDSRGAFAAEPAAYTLMPGSLSADGEIYTTNLSGLTITTRKGWGADESDHGWTPETITIKGAVVHHTAGTNDYTKAQVPEVLRGVYRYHAFSLGWGDIGYNIVVDRYGGVWEGRKGGLTRGIQGGHAFGANSSTFGISVLGTFTNEAPPAAALTSVAKAVAWKLAVHGIDSSTRRIWLPGEDGRGRTVPVVSAHRDVGFTACPGNAFYPLMDKVRADVTVYLSKIGEGGNSSGPQGLRISGADRYETAAEIAQEAFPQGTKVAYLASGSSPVDALVGGMVKDGPVLLVKKDSVPATTSARIAALGVTKVYAIGGTSAISDATLAAAKPRGGTTGRLSGQDRAGTAVAVAQHVFKGAVTKTYVADSRGEDSLGSPDAVAAGNLSDGQVLVTQKGRSVDAITQANLKGNVIELGSADLGTGAKSRLAGADRYLTSIEIAKVGFPKGAKTVYLARGDVFIDAVAAGSLSAGPVVLTTASTLQSGTCAYLRSLKPTRIIGLGGSTAVSNEVIDQARNCARG